MTRRKLETMTRKELVEWLEGTRDVACFDHEGTELLRECALEDYDDCGQEEGFADD